MQFGIFDTLGACLGEFPAVEANGYELWPRPTPIVLPWRSVYFVRATGGDDADAAYLKLISAEGTDAHKSNRKPFEIRSPLPVGEYRLFSQTWDRRGDVLEACVGRFAVTR